MMFARFTTKKLPDWLFPWGLIGAFILTLAIWLRLAGLGAIPAGLSWDEAYLGYVGKMVITTRRDEFGTLLPVVFPSFGDYKAPLAVYITGLSTTLFGLSVWATRLPYAVAGVVSVILLAKIVWFRTKAWGWSLLAAWILATLPWHIHFSRIAFESGLATFFFALLLLGWQGVRQLPLNSKGGRAVWWSCVVIGMLGGMYVYHSSKVVFPLAIFTIVGWEVFFSWKTWKTRWREWLPAGLLGALGLLPFIWSTQQGGLTRASQTVFWRALYPGETWIHRLFVNILEHLSWDFLVLGATDTLRHGTGFAGTLTGTIVVVFTLGTLWLIWQTMQQNPLFSLRAWWNSKRSQAPPDGLWLWITLLAIGVLPAIIGFEVPHANRSLLAVIPLVVVLIEILRRLQKTLHGNAQQTLIAGFILFSALESAAFWKDLSLEYGARSSAAWIEGTMAMSQWAGQAAQTGASIAISKELGQPEIFFAFANNWPIERYRARDFGSIHFVDQSGIENASQQRIVSTLPLEHPQLTLVKEIVRQDGLSTYWIYARN
jgi:4-amino-4-deoxy-L-arabinose transferase-like glycosyltransferase